MGNEALVGRSKVLDSDFDNDENFVHGERAGREVAEAAMRASGTKMISLRLQASLISDLQAIAEINGIGYQTLLKQVLFRFVEAERKRVWNEFVATQRQKPSENPSQEVEPAKAGKTKAARSGTKKAA